MVQFKSSVLGFRVDGLWFMVYGLWSRVEGVGQTSMELSWALYSSTIEISVFTCERATGRVL